MQTDGEIARRIVETAAYGTLATLTRAEDPFPFASLVAVAADGEGRPLLFLSALAEHTKNLGASPRASLLVADSTSTPLAAPRVTVLGDCVPVPDEDVEPSKARYLARHPDAAAWIGFADFRLYRLFPRDVRVVVGFGRMSWVSPEAYAASRR